MEIVIGLWIACGITCAVIASGKGRSGFGWFIMGLLFSIFAVVMIACLPAQNARYAVAVGPEAERDAADNRRMNVITGAVLVAVIVVLAMLT